MPQSSELNKNKNNIFKTCDVTCYFYDLIIILVELNYKYFLSFNILLDF